MNPITAESWNILRQVHPSLFTKQDDADDFTTTPYCGASVNGRAKVGHVGRKPKPRRLTYEPRPGEVSLKVYKQMLARERNTTVEVISNALNRKSIPYPEVRRINSRIIFVKIN